MKIKVESKLTWIILFLVNTLRRRNIQKLVFKVNSQVESFTIKLKI